MTYFAKREIGGEKCFVGFPIGEHRINGDGSHFSCNIWPNRLSDCFVNGRRVNEIQYRMAKRGQRRRRTMTPDDLRFLLKCPVR